MNDEEVYLWMFEHGAQFKKQGNRLSVEAQGFHVVWLKISTQGLMSQIRLVVMALKKEIDNDNRIRSQASGREGHSIELLCHPLTSYNQTQVDREIQFRGQDEGDLL